MLDISGIGKLDPIVEMEGIKDLDICQLGDSLNRLLSKRMCQEEKESVFQIVKSIEDYTPVSIEFLQYLMMTAEISHRDTISAMGTNFLRGKTKSRIGKVKKILKERCDIKKVRASSYFKKLVINRGSIGFVNSKRVYNFIEFKEKSSQ